MIKKTKHYGGTGRVVTKFNGISVYREDRINLGKGKGYRVKITKDKNDKQKS